MSERLFEALLTVFHRDGPMTMDEAALLIDLGMVRFDDGVLYVTDAGAERVIQRMPRVLTSD